MICNIQWYPIKIDHINTYFYFRLWFQDKKGRGNLEKFQIWPGFWFFFNVVWIIGVKADFKIYKDLKGDKLSTLLIKYWHAHEFKKCVPASESSKSLIFLVQCWVIYTAEYNSAILWLNMYRGLWCWFVHDAWCSVRNGKSLNTQTNQQRAQRATKSSTTIISKLRAQNRRSYACGSKVKCSKCTLQY